jgi:PilZ domain
MSGGAEFGRDPQDAGDRFAERRAVPRYPLKAEIEVFEPIERIKLTAQVSEIGLNGCYIQMAAPLQRHTVIQLIIQKDGESFKSWGMVVYAHEGGGMGITFFRPEPSQVKTLQAWIGDLHVRRQAR